MPDIVYWRRDVDIVHARRVTVLVQVGNEFLHLSHGPIVHVAPDIAQRPKAPRDTGVSEAGTLRVSFALHFK